MIYGIGVDIVEIERISDILKKNARFLVRNFTEEENAIFRSKADPVQTIAAHFAAKEAVSKAMGTGIRGFNLIDISIERDSLGAPIVVCKNEAERLRTSLHINKIHLSLSHSAHYAIAQAIAEK